MLNRAFLHTFFALNFCTSTVSGLFNTALRTTRNKRRTM